jgi:hypothetical protein
MSIDVWKKQPESAFKVVDKPVGNLNMFAPPVVKKVVPKKEKPKPKTYPDKLSEMFRAAIDYGDIVNGCGTGTGPGHIHACIEYTIAKYLEMKQASFTHEAVQQELKGRGLKMLPDYYQLKCGHCKDANKSYIMTGEFNLYHHMMENHVPNPYQVTDIINMISQLEDNSVSPGEQVDVKLNTTTKQPLLNKHIQND